LNTIFYNPDEVNKRLGNIQTSTAAPTIPSMGPCVKDSFSVIAPINGAIIDKRINLITEGIESFMASNLRELPKDNALTIAEYIHSMKSEINLSDSYRSY
jgi:hypothetical protein